MLLSASPVASWLSYQQAAYGTRLASMQAAQRAENAVRRIPWPGENVGRIWSLGGGAGLEPGSGDEPARGALTWAWDDALCAHLEPHFHEDVSTWSLIDCATIRAAMHRAFDAWSANHRLLSFVDVTDECRRRANTSGVVTASGGGCALADIMIAPRDSHDCSSMAATATTTVAIRPDFVFSNGVRAYGAIVETVAATIAFGGARVGCRSVCWYLDSSFCTSVHALRSAIGGGRSGASTAVRFVLVAFVALVSSLALVVTLLQISVIAKACASARRRAITHLARRSTVVASALGRFSVGQLPVQQGDGRDTRSSSDETSWAARCSAAVEAVSKWSLCGTALRLACIVTPPLAYVHVFAPCFDCFDFSAAASKPLPFELGNSPAFSQPTLAVLLPFFPSCLTFRLRILVRQSTRSGTPSGCTTPTRPVGARSHTLEPTGRRMRSSRSPAQATTASTRWRACARWESATHPRRAQPPPDRP